MTLFYTELTLNYIYIFIFKIFNGLFYKSASVAFFSWFLFVCFSSLLLMVFIHTVISLNIRILSNNPNIWSSCGPESTASIDTCSQSPVCWPYCYELMPVSKPPLNPWRRADVFPPQMTWVCCSQVPRSSNNLDLLFKKIQFIYV